MDSFPRREVRMKNWVVQEGLALYPQLPPISNPGFRSWRQDNMWRESQPFCTPWRRVQKPASCLNDSLRFSSSPFSLKTVMAEQNLQSWSPDISHLLPRLLAFLIKALFLSTDTCLSNYWLMSSKQPNLDSIWIQIWLKCMWNNHRI